MPPDHHAPDLAPEPAPGRMEREMPPEAHFATLYAKSMGRPPVDTFMTEADFFRA
jgi:hypothetical protein